MAKIQEQLKQDMKEAMRNRKENPERLSVIRMIIDRIQKKEKEVQKELNHEEVIQILQTFKKQNGEEIDAFTGATISDTHMEKIKKLTREIGVIMSYLPQQMTHEQVKVAVLSIIDENSNLRGNINKGSLMKVVMPQLKGKADNKTISDVVGEIIVEYNDGC